MGYFWGWGKVLQLIFWSTHVVEQPLFSLFLSILTFEFDEILGSFFIFGALMGYLFGWGRIQTLFWGLLM